MSVISDWAEGKLRGKEAFFWGGIQNKGHNMVYLKSSKVQNYVSQKTFSIVKKGLGEGFCILSIPVWVGH